MQKNRISIDVQLDEDKMPEYIGWSAAGTTAENFQEAKAMMISFWDGADKSAMRIDLWTKKMMVDEMGDFFYQTLTSMGETLNRSTKYDELSEDLKKFAKEFYAKFRKKQLEENKA